MPTNVFFSPAVRSEQMLFEDLIIEGLRMYGQDVLYIPRNAITTDEILNEEYSQFNDAYAVEMYIANTEGFEGEGNLLSKFGLEIRDQATFIVARRRFRQLVDINVNSVKEERPREGDLIYLPLSNSLFQINFVEHEQPFYRLSNLPTYELQCELYEYSVEKFETGYTNVDEFERESAARTVVQVTGGSTGFAAGSKVYQIIQAASGGDEEIRVTGEVADFVQTRAEESDVERQADLSLVGISVSDGSINTFSTEFGPVYLEEDNSDTGWDVTDVYDIYDDDDKFIQQDPFADNSRFEIDADQIIDFSESNPFGEVQER